MKSVSYFLMFFLLLCTSICRANEDQRCNVVNTAGDALFGKNVNYRMVIEQPRVTLILENDEKQRVQPYLKSCEALNEKYPKKK
jgi:hypothetical protein